MSFQVYYHPSVKKADIPKLDPAIAKRVKKAIEEKLMTRPEIFGVPLRYSKNGDRKLRIGDYRVIFRIQKKLVKVFLIQHRSVVYRTLRLRSQEFSL